MRRRDRSERGAATLETVGVTTVAVALVCGIVVGFALHGAGLVSSLSAGLCAFSTSIGLGGTCETAPTMARQADEDIDEFRPKSCLLTETTQKNNTELSLMWVKVGQSTGFVVQEFSDLSVRATMIDGTSIAAGADITSKAIDTSKLGDGPDAGAELKLTADLKFDYGSTWTFESMDEFTDMKTELDSYVAARHRENSPEAGAALFALWQNRDLEPPKDPNITFFKSTLSAAFKGNAGTRVGSGTTDAAGKERVLNPEAGFNLTMTPGAAVVVMEDSKAGTTSSTVELSGQGKIGADMVLGHITGEGKVTGALTVTRDAEDHELTEVVMRTAMEYGAGGALGNGTFKSVSGKLAAGETTSVVTTTKLAVTDDNRAMVEDWIANHSDGTTMSLPFNAMIPDRASADPFEQLLHEKATSSQIEYHNVKSSSEFGMAVKKGWELGFQVSEEESTASATDAQYLGAPRSDGTRSMLDDPTCA